MNVPSNLRYTEAHEWVRAESDGTLTVGITDHAQAALGDLVYLELPTVGRVVAAGEACAVVESVKAASDVYAPIAGEVLAVNSPLTIGIRLPKLKGQSQDEPAAAASVQLFDENGNPAILQSRAIDDTGYVQPKINQLREVRGTRSVYHNNAIQSWKLSEDGEVTNVQAY